MSQTLTMQRSGPSKLVVGFLVAAITALVGTVGVVGATPIDKPTKADCEAAGFKNYGQCVREWAKERGHGGGSGYGGGNTTVGGDVNVEASVTINGDNNVVNIVVNYFLGL
jgi:hypothetical protein